MQILPNIWFKQTFLAQDISDTIRDLEMVISGTSFPHKHASPRTAESVVLPRALFLDPAEHTSPDYALAFGMALHPRLGQSCCFNALEPNLLKQILHECTEPASLHSFIRRDLQSAFPGLLPLGADDSRASLDDNDAAACVDRLYSFLTFLARFLEQDQHCQSFVESLDSTSLCSKPAVPPLPLAHILSAMPGRCLQSGVIDHYLWVICQVLGAEYVHAERITGQLRSFNPSRQEMPRRHVLLSSGVSDLLAISLRDHDNGDFVSFPMLAKQLKTILGPFNYRSVWLVHGLNYQSTIADISGTAWLSLRMDKQEQKVVSLVLDPTTQNPDLNSLRISPGIALSKLFQGVCKEFDEDFMQLHGDSAHQRRFPQTPTFCHALLNLAAQLEGTEPPVDGSSSEVSAAALRVHMSCVLIKQLLESCASTLDMNALFRRWLDGNPVPHGQPVTRSAEFSTTETADAGHPVSAQVVPFCDGGNSTRESCLLVVVGGVSGESGEGGEGGEEFRKNRIHSFVSAAAAAPASWADMAMLDVSNSVDDGFKSCRDEVPSLQPCILTCTPDKRKRSAFRICDPTLLSGQGHLLVHGRICPVEMKFEMSRALSFGSPVHAVLSELFCWGDDVFARLELHLCLYDSIFDWTKILSSLRRWRGFGEQSMTKKDISLFRQHVASLLLDDRNATACFQFFQQELTDDDLCVGDMAGAEAIARSLGFNFNLGNNVHRWAVAILHPNFQFCVKILQFLLQVEFEGRIGIATVIRKLQQSSEKALMNPVIPGAKSDNVYSYSICPVDQPTMQTGPGSCIVMAVLQEAGAFPSTSKDPGTSKASHYSRLSIKHGHYGFPLWFFMDSYRAAEEGAKESPRFDPYDDSAHGSGPRTGPTELHKRVVGSGVVKIDSRDHNVEALQRQIDINNFFRVASNGVRGSCGGCGVSGSIGPKGIYDIFSWLDLQGRCFMDIGGGDGRVSVAAGCFGSSQAWAIELAVNRGYFHIFKSAIGLMEKDPVWSRILRSFPFEIRNSLMPNDVDKVA